MNLLDGADQQTNERDEILSKWKDKSKEEILEAKINSDLYIKTIEKQKDEMRDDLLSTREELLAKAKWEDMIDQHQKNLTNDFQAAPLAKEAESPKIDTKEFQDLIKKEIAETRLRDKQEANYKLVENKLKEHFGNNYQTVLKDTGLSGSRITEIAMESPEALYRLVGITENAQRESFQAPPRSNQRNDSFAPRGPTKRDYTYYQELKKSNPKLYLDPKIAVQMHNDVLEMGEVAFYGNA